MAKKYQDMDIAEKIEVKKRKIKKLFKELPSDKAQFADGLIAQFAVTSVTLERLADEINGGELIEDFVQGSQSMRRESPALRSFTRAPSIVARWTVIHGRRRNTRRHGSG